MPVPKTVSGALPIRSPELFASSIIGLASSTVRASGFSPKTCFPAVNAFIAITA